MSEPRDRGTWPLTDEGTELLERCLADVWRELIEQAQQEAEYLYADGDVPRRLIGEHAIFNAFAELAWNGFSVKPNEPEFQAVGAGSASEPMVESRTYQRTVLALRFHFFNPNGSTSELPVVLNNDDGKHRPLDRRKTWMDLRKGSQIVLWYPGKAPRLRRVDQVILWMSQPTLNGLPEIVSGRDWVENGRIVGPRR